MHQNYGGAEAPKPIPPEFLPSGDPENLSADVSAKTGGDSSEPDKALAEFASLGKAEKISGIKGSGKAPLTTKGPSPQRV